MKRWHWYCIWDDGVGADRDCCRARSRNGHKTKELAEKAGNRHLKEAKHRSVYSERFNKKATISLRNK